VKQHCQQHRAVLCGLEHAAAGLAALLRAARGHVLLAARCRLNGRCVELVEDLNLRTEQACVESCMGDRLDLNLAGKGWKIMVLVQCARQCQSKTLLRNNLSYTPLDALVRCKCRVHMSHDNLTDILRL
jgi:hypothetical protein